MEVRGQAKEIGMPDSIGYTPQFNQESSSAKLSSTQIGSILPERRSELSYISIVSPNQTLVQPHLTQNHDHQLNQYHHDHEHEHDHEQLQVHKRRDNSPDSDPDPDPAPALDTGGTIADAPSSKTASTRPRLARGVSTSSGSTSVRYRECLKNHAASMGGHVLDGCGEFMASGAEGTPEGLKCAACECHRSFHRKEVDGESQARINHYSTTYHHGNTSNTIHRATIHHRPPPLPAVPPQQSNRQNHKYTQGYTRVFSTSPTTGHVAVPMMMAFGANNVGAPAESSSEDLNMFQSNAATQAADMRPFYSISKKRFRTKFTQQQKDKMHEFAEKLGWTMQKQEERQVQQFCDEVGVKRQVFKVWMHNNKQAMKKKQM